MRVHPFRRWYCGLCMLLIAIGAMGCAGSSKYMRQLRGHEPITASADKATVVFVRPSGMGFAINFAILDHQGKWVGDAVAQSHFAITLRPGEYMFIGWAENTAALKATLAAGRLYYVEVVPSMGFGSAHVALEALTPRHEDWKELRKWLAETKRLEPLPSGVDYIEERREDAIKRVASAKENWEGYSKAEREKRTLRVEDGEGTGALPSAAAGPRGGAACSKDTQCPGEQVCDNARCVGPDAQKVAASACSKDTDCPGDLICQGGACKQGGSATPVAATPTQPAPTSPAPSATAGSSAKCEKNADCANEQFCSKGQCTPVPGSTPSQPTCKKTSECPAETVCKKNRCVAPDAN